MSEEKKKKKDRDNPRWIGWKSGGASQRGTISSSSEAASFEDVEVLRRPPSKPLL